MTSRRGLMLVISSPSGTGKTTLCRRLLAEVGGVTLSVSATTRPMRPGETDGQDYHFVSAREFDAGIASGDFLEWARVHAERYGTPASRIDRQLAAGTDILFDVDWQGARALKAVRPGDVVSVFVLPPSLAELRARLEKRPGATAKATSARLAGAASDISRWGEYDYALVNDDLERAFFEIRAILETERIRRHRPLLGEHVDTLLAP